MRALTENRNDFIGASISVEDIAGIEDRFLYQARIVAYLKPENIAVAEKRQTAKSALKDALSNIDEHIRTLDNRMVIVPNSVIGRNQVENFADTDPSIRVDINIGIDYNSDIDHAIETIRAAVLSVSEISDRELPFVKLAEFGDSALILRVLYWLESYMDIRVQAKVNKAICDALTKANIEMPFITYDVNLSYKDQAVAG